MINLRKDFPYLTCDNKIIYFDNAATSQKPYQVIDRISYYYKCQNAPVHRGIYSRSESLTELYEQSRTIVADFIGAYSDEIVFVKNATEGINFIASTWAESNLKSGDEIILSELEHHANILPWLNLSKKLNFKIRFIPITPQATLDYQAYLEILSEKTKLVSVTSCSNAIGTLVDTNFIITQAKKYNAKVLIDAAQTVGHEKLNVRKLKPDFLVFSGHKILGPTGIGVLYISREMQNFVEPYQFGGGMVFQVECYNASWLKPPQRYEAGTPPIAQAIGLAEAINYINKIDFKKLKAHETSLSSELISGLEEIKGIKILGPVDQLSKSGHIVSFISDSMHPHDIAAYLDQYNIAVRAGNHCAQPLYNKLGITGSIRVSFYIYNTLEEVRFMLKILKKLFKKNFTNK